MSQGSTHPGNTRKNDPCRVKISLVDLKGHPGNFLAHLLVIKYLAHGKILKKEN